MRRDPIVIVDYDPAWPAMFEAERARVQPAMDRWLVRPIEHVGSTAIPGLAAKPIIDMVAVVGDIDAARHAGEALGPLGWIHAPEPGDAAGRRLSFCAPSVAFRTHHLHVVEDESEGWRGWLAFRDHLRLHPEIAADYAALKRNLADRYGADPNERDAYRNGKAAFITNITGRAIGSSPP
jgi:GrpB-like predicted nucleotidyltransferase (UPF0157 family)